MATLDPLESLGSLGHVISAPDYFTACERGRRMALAAIMSNPEARRRVEGVYGLDYCRSRYPEAYLRFPK